MGQNTTKDFPYVVENDQEETKLPSGWSLRSGVCQEDKKPVSIFYRKKDSNGTPFEAAHNHVKQLRQVLHPNVLQFFDGKETDEEIYIATEAVQPLRSCLPGMQKYPNYFAWGIFQVASALHFIHSKCNAIHGNVVLSSIYVNRAGEWKLGGFDLFSKFKGIEDAAPLKRLCGKYESKYYPPEVAKGAWSSVSRGPVHAVDMWMFGCLCYEIYSGTLSSPEQLKDMSKIPRVLTKSYQRMFNPRASSRISTSELLKDKFFSNNLVQTCLFLESIALKDQRARDKLFTALSSMVDRFPPAVCKYKLLPQLVSALDYASAGARALSPVLKIGTYLTPAEYEKMVTPSIVKWFACNDRAIRIQLLQNLSSIVEHLSNDMVANSVYPSIVNGFTDTSPRLRELTVKSMLLIVPKLPRKVVEDQVLRYFAKMQTDEDALIRTNTTICLGKISRHLHPATRKKILISAFGKSMQDPHPSVRSAGIKALGATSVYFGAQDCANKALPALCRMMVDPERDVRQVSFTAAKTFIDKLQAISDGKEPSTPSGETESIGYLGWVMGIASKKLYGGEAKAEPKASGSKPVSSNPGHGVCAGETSEEEEEKEEEAKQKPTSVLGKVTRQASEEGWDNQGWSSSEWDEEEEETEYQEGGTSGNGEPGALPLRTGATQYPMSLLNPRTQGISTQAQQRPTDVSMMYKALGQFSSATTSGWGVPEKDPPATSDTHRDTGEPWDDSGDGWEDAKDGWDNVDDDQWEDVSDEGWD